MHEIKCRAGDYQLINLPLDKPNRPSSCLGAVTRFLQSLPSRIAQHRESLSSAPGEPTSRKAILKTTLGQILSYLIGIKAMLKSKEEEEDLLTLAINGFSSTRAGC